MVQNLHLVSSYVHTSGVDVVAVFFVGKVTMRPQMRCQVAMPTPHEYGGVSRTVLIENEQGVWMQCLSRMPSVSAYE